MAKASVVVPAGAIENAEKAKSVYDLIRTAARQAIAEGVNKESFLGYVGSAWKFETDKAEKKERDELAKEFLSTLTADQIRAILAQQTAK